MRKLFRSLTIGLAVFFIAASSSVAGTIRLLDEGVYKGYPNALDLVGAGIAASRVGTVGTITLDVPSAEADTLDSVSDRGATTNQTLTAGGFTTAGTMTADIFGLSGNMYNLNATVAAEKNIGFAALGSIVNVLRGRTIEHVEYWDGDSWEIWAQSMTNISDGDNSTSVSIDNAHAKFRITWSGMNWRREFALGILKGYGGGTYNTAYSLLLETSADDIDYSTVKDWGSGGSKHYQDVFLEISENGNSYWRLTWDYGAGLVTNNAQIFEVRDYGIEPSQRPLPLQWDGALGSKFGGAVTFQGDTVVDSSGNVGIGTISPYSGLHYQGDILYLTPAAGADSNDDITIKNYATGNGAPNIILRTADIDGAYGIGVGTLSLIGGSKTTHYGGIGGGGGKISLQGGQGRDAANDPSGYAPVLLQSNGGNVGIGTTSPDSVFHIKANIAGTVGSHPAGQIIIQNPIDSVFSNAVITAYESDGSGNPDQQLWYLGSSSSGSSDIIFLNRRNAKLALGTNGSSRLTILGSGNVGIGDPDPDSLLELAGAMTLQEMTAPGTPAADKAVIYLDSADGSLKCKFDDGDVVVLATY